MIVSLTIAFVIYAVRVMLHGTAVTPDGHYYLSRGAGLRVPRPYSLRLLPRLVPADMMTWRVVHAVSYAAVAIAVHFIAERMGISGPVAVASVLTVHWMRQGIAWPVLLDMPMLAVCCVIAATAPYMGDWVAFAVYASVIVHERAPLWAALYALPFADPLMLIVGVLAAAAVTLYAYRQCEPHPNEQTIEWLRNPVQAAVDHHAAHIHDWNAWLRPWGGLAIGMATLNPYTWLVIMVAYPSCLFTIDRARIYGMAVVPLTMSACVVLGDYAPLVPLANWFVSSQEI